MEKLRVRSVAEKAKGYSLGDDVLITPKNESDFPSITRFYKRTPRGFKTLGVIDTSKPTTITKWRYSEVKDIESA